MQGMSGLYKNTKGAKAHQIQEEIKAHNNDDMIPVEEWDGDCWKAFFEGFCVPNGEANDVSPWEYLANFIKYLLGESVEN